MLLTGGSVAVGELDPLILLIVFILELDNLDIGWFLSVLKDLHKLGVVLLWPLLAARWLAMHVPVTVWTKTTISGLNMAVLVLHNLVLVLCDWVLGVEDWVVNWQWLPVGVVGSILGLVGL